MKAFFKEDRLCNTLFQYKTKIFCLQRKTSEKMIEFLKKMLLLSSWETPETLTVYTVENLLEKLKALRYAQ